ncbi:hypothetical protein OT109_09100 [Phycisphaeraceae bacterium D3-23]
MKMSEYLPPLVRDGRRVTPCCFFLKTRGELTETALLSELGLTDFKSEQNRAQFDEYIVLADDGEWIHLSDDWFYTLWHDTTMLRRFRAMGRRYDLFAFSIGDTDCSFDLEYWALGDIQRRFVWDESVSETGKVTCDVGQAFPKEQQIIHGKEPKDALWDIASSLGIQTDYESLEMLVYTRPHLRNRKDAGKGICGGTRPGPT